jgi:transposase
MCTSFSNGRRHDFRLFKESKVRIRPETEGKADTGYAGIHKYHKNSVLPRKKSKKKPLSKEDRVFKRHDVSDKVWEILSPHLPGQRGQWGRIAYDNRKFMNGVFWVLRTGAPWRDLPPYYGKWNTIARRFRRWCINGIWEKLLEILIDEPDFEWLMIDASHCKVHPHGSGAVGGNQDMERTKGGSTRRYIGPWMRMVV